MTTAIERQTISERLALIARKHRGRLDAEDVVEAARPEDSALHRYFEWDDSVAAEKHRLAQARHLISSFRIELTAVQDDELNRVPAWVTASRGASASGYVSTLTIEPNSDQAKELMLREVARAIGFMRRAVAVSDTVGLRDEATEVLRTVEALQEQITKPRRGRKRGSQLIEAEVVART